jgi:predicted nucleic acid-binding protein
VTVAAVVDTSVFIASETGRVVQDAPVDEALVSVVTLAELQAGVLTADDPSIRARRLLTLDAVSDMAILPIDERAALEWARMRVLLAASRRRVNVNDLWIAASASAARLPVLTQDEDFDVLRDVAGLEVIRV